MSKLLRQRGQIELEEVVARNKRDGKAQAEAEAEALREHIRGDFIRVGDAEAALRFFEQGVALGKRMMGHK